MIRATCMSVHPVVVRPVAGRGVGVDRGGDASGHSGGRGEGAAGGTLHDIRPSLTRWEAVLSLHSRFGLFGRELSGHADRMVGYEKGREPILMTDSRHVETANKGHIDPLYVTGPSSISTGLRPWVNST